MRMLSRIGKKALRLVPVFFFFLIFFTLINSVEVFLFKRAGITPFNFWEIAIAAALITKIVFVVDELPIAHVFREKPLAYGILWKTGLYWILLLPVRFLIRFIPYLFATGGSITMDLTWFSTQFDWSLFLSIQAFYLLLLFIFVTFQELTYKIGVKKMRKLFFGKGSLPSIDLTL